MLVLKMASVGFRWLDILEKEFDKAFVDLDLAIGELDSEEPDVVYNVRQKLCTLSSCFAQLTHKAQTIFQSSAKIEAELIHMRVELVEAKAKKDLLEQELHNLLLQLHSSQLSLLPGLTGNRLQNSKLEPDVTNIKKKLEEEIKSSPTHNQSIKENEEIKFSPTFLEAAQLRAENSQLQLENTSLRNSIVALNGEVYGAKLAAQYLDKELAGRIQQLQLLGREMQGDVRNKLWRQLESEILLQRHKTVVRACRRNSIISNHSQFTCSKPSIPIIHEESTQHFGDVRTVIVKRKAGQGLGISITGGREHGVPILISELEPNGPAAVSGQLYIGDAILFVNDEDLRQACHREAVEILQKQIGDCELQVQYIAADDSDNSLEEDGLNFRFFNCEVCDPNESINLHPLHSSGVMNTPTAPRTPESTSNSGFLKMAFQRMKLKGNKFYRYADAEGEQILVNQHWLSLNNTNLLIISAVLQKTSSSKPLKVKVQLLCTHLININSNLLNITGNLQNSYSGTLPENFISHNRLLQYSWKLEFSEPRNLNTTESLFYQARPSSVVEMQTSLQYSSILTHSQISNNNSDLIIIDNEHTNGLQTTDNQTIINNDNSTANNTQTYEINSNDISETTNPYLINMENLILTNNYKQIREHAENMLDDNITKHLEMYSEQNLNCSTNSLLSDNLSSPMQTSTDIFLDSEILSTDVASNDSHSPKNIQNIAAESHNNLEELKGYDDFSLTYRQTSLCTSNENCSNTKSDQSLLNSEESCDSSPIHKINRDYKKISKKLKNKKHFGIKTLQSIFTRRDGYSDISSTASEFGDDSVKHDGDTQVDDGTHTVDNFTTPQFEKNIHQFLSETFTKNFHFKEPSTSSVIIHRSPGSNKYYKFNGQNVRIGKALRLCPNDEASDQTLSPDPDQKKEKLLARYVYNSSMLSIDGIGDPEFGTPV